ncbi:hypothetical protein BKA93DRAFT_742312 [Sparassis latifolia]
MSFSDLRSARQSKQYRSCVKAVASIAQAAPPLRSANDKSERGTPAGTSDGCEVVDLKGLHQSLPSYLEIRKTDRAGRGVYAKNASKTGSVLFFRKPHVSVLSTSCIDTHCSSCCEPAPDSGLRRCTRCRSVWYCGIKCQNSDWSLHKNECIALQRWATSAPSPELAIPSDAIRCLGRILWSAQKEGLDSLWTREIYTMQSHRSSLPPSAFESHTHLAHSIVRYVGVSSPTELAAFGLSSAGDLVDLISRFTTNTFTLTSPSLTPLGVSVCPTIALANHSCDPNAVIVFPRASSDPQAQEPLMHLVAIKDIAPDEEVLTAYVDTTLPQAKRQRELEETYNFSCGCALCSKKLTIDPRASMWCPEKCGGTCPVPTEENNFSRCTQCRAVVSSTNAVLDALRLGQEALDKASFLQYKDPRRAERLTANMIPILSSAGLTPSCHPLLAIYRLRLELLIASLSSSITQEVLDETIRTAAKYSAGLTSVLSPGHPVRGVALAELGKLLAVDEPSSPATGGETKFPPSGAARLRLAYETLVRARDELVVGFGSQTGGGLVGQEVRETLIRLEKELGVWTQGIRNVIVDTPVEKTSQ